MDRLHVMAGGDYLAEHEPVTRYLFEGVRRFIDLGSSVDMVEIGCRSAKPETVIAAQAELDRYASNQAALGVLAGSILQVADLGLTLCSTTHVVPESAHQFIGGTSDWIKYCVGRRVFGLPVGLYVHAGRNQYAHWGDEQEYNPQDRRPAGFNKLTQQVFDHLAEIHYSDPFQDLVYDLGNTFYRGWTPIRSASIVLSVLKWRD